MYEFIELYMSQLGEFLWSSEWSTIIGGAALWLGATWLEEKWW